VLDKIAVFLAATMFFIAISIPFPHGVNWANWIIYPISLLVIAICNICYQTRALHGIYFLFNVPLLNIRLRCIC
jgi:hypothetical protein